MFYLWFFILGLIFGSFANVLIYRLGNNKNFWRQRSYCPKCDKTLEWFELIPLVSYLVQKGRCRSCQKKISWFYPTVELIMAILFVIGFAFYGWQLALLKYLIFCLFALPLIFIDGWKQEVPDNLSLTASILILIISLIEQKNPEQLLLAIFVGAGFFAVLHYFSKGKWMGDGDIRLGALMGVILANIYSLGLALVLACFMASIYGLIRNLISRKWISKIAFGPFLLIATFTALFVPFDVVLRLITII